MYFTIFYKNDSRPFLKPNEKILFGELLMEMDDEKIFCKDVADLHVVKGRNLSTIKKWLKSLEQKGYIEMIPHKNIVELLKNKKLDGYGFGNKTCEWCCVKTSVLHAHHYPVPKSEGGKITVDICPNCHHEFHFDSGCIKIVISEVEFVEVKNIKSEFFKMKGSIE